MNKPEIPPIAAIIPAAGQGTRLGGQTKKQFRLLAGRPLLVHTLEQVVAAPDVRWLVVAVPEANLDETHSMISAILPPAVELHLTVGGNTRQRSVANALVEVPAEAQIVMVHDADRPCLDPAWITRTAELCRTYDGAIVAVPAVDTLKEVDLEAGEQGGMVKGTLARKVVWKAQTPQTFRASVFRGALAHAEESGLTGTDECRLVEAIGGRVAVVRGSSKNVKVTSLEDWDFLEWRLTHA